jgi:hypothetical protein
MNLQQSLSAGMRRSHAKIAPISTIQLAQRIAVTAMSMRDHRHATPLPGPTIAVNLPLLI